MKVLIVSNGYPPGAYGGVEIYSRDLASGLTARGYQVAVFTRESNRERPDYQVDESTREGIPVFTVINDFKGTTAFSGTYHDTHIDQIFRDILQKLKPDLVHFNHLIGLSAGLPGVAQQAGVPSLIFLHDYWEFCNRVHLINRDGMPCTGPGQGANCHWCVTSYTGKPTLKLRLLQVAKFFIPFRARLALRRLRGVTTPVMFPIKPQDFEVRRLAFQEALANARVRLTPSAFAREMYYKNGFDASSIQVLPLGIRTETLKRSPFRGGEQVRFGFTASFIPYKGVDVLIKAFRAVPNENIRLDLYGRNDLEPVYSRQVAELAAGDPRITMKGPYQPGQVGDIFAAFDVLVVPSAGHETFSLVTREALASGKPVIASRVGALPEIIRDGVNGFVVEPGDMNSLARVITSIADNPQQLSRLDLPGPVDILSVSDHLDRLNEIYAEILQVKVQ